MKAMVIGAAGFVGNYLIDAIHKDLFCDVWATKLPNHHFVRSDVEIVDLNVLDAGKMSNIIHQVKPDYVFYLAAQSSIARSWQNPTKTVEINVRGGLNLLDALRKMDPPPRVLIIGSGEEYGLVSPNDVPIREDVPLNPQNIYAATKACQNMIATVYQQAYSLPIMLIRAFNHIGPGQADTFVVSDFCHQIAKIESGIQEPVIKVGNLSARRDFTDVRDVVRAYTVLAQFGSPGETYNVGHGHAISIQNVLDTVIEQSEVPINVFVDKKKLRPIDAPIIEPDISKLYSATGWKPEIPLQDSIKEMLEYWRNEHRGE